MGYANNYATTLAAGITNSATSITVASASGIPAAPFTAVIGAESGNSDEVVLVTAVSGTTLTVVRGWEPAAGGAGAGAHSIGALLVAVITAGDFTPVAAGALLTAFNNYR